MTNLIVPNCLKLSVSKCKTFQDCKKKFEFAYVIKLPRKEFHFHAFGKVCHQILEDFHNIYIKGCNDPYHITMTNVYRAVIKDNQEKMTKEMRAEAWDIINKYLKLIMSPNGRKIVKGVLACEKGFELLINNEKVLLNGSIDRVDVDDDGILTVIDYKTTKNKKYIKDDYFQLLTYAYTLLCEDPTIQKVRAAYVLLRHNFERISFEFTREEILGIEDKYIAYAQGILSEKEYAPTPTMLCQYCDFLSSCTTGKAKVSPSTVFGEVSWD